MVAGEEFIINLNEHLSLYDGLKTNQKLEMLSKYKNLPVSSHDEIWKIKQKLTLESVSNIEQNSELIQLFKWLNSNNYKIGCCSNSIRKTVLVILSKLGIIEYMVLILSNEDVKNSKPHPEIYWKAMSTLGLLPEETLIVEDSPHGLLAAHRSKSNILRVDSSKDVTITTISKKLLELTNSNIVQTPKWRNKKMNVLIPMAGAGSRFEKAGYTFPKPLIEVKGKPMIQVVVDNLNIDANYIFVVQKSHREKYNLDTMLNLIAPGCKVIETQGITEGAACTALLAKEFINNDEPLFFANSDQFVEWDSNEFMYKMH
jgi:HAD superfamily hydrolase (TIGR01509 family)